MDPKHAEGVDTTRKTGSNQNTFPGEMGWSELIPAILQIGRFVSRNEVRHVL